MQNVELKAFESGTHNKLDSELIPQDAASNAHGWITKDGQIQLTNGRQLIGAAGTTGKIYQEHTAEQANGTQVRFRKTDTKIQHYNTTTLVWSDVITGLSAGFVTFADYSSLAGGFVYIFCLDGIYKICTANPTDYTSLYVEAKNFKGYGIIDKGRTVLWGRAQDATGLYGSYIDSQDSDVYTTVSGESVTNVASETLDFKAGAATRTCFGVTLTVTTSGQVFTDDFNGTLTGDAGGTGTINYTTGAITTDDTGAGTATYQWEDSNENGLTDFTKSGTRLAGEGFVLRQDVGGDAIQVVIPYDGSYFSLKANSCYKLTIDVADTDPLNEIFRTDIGVASPQSAYATSLGIVFMDTANPTEPRMSIIKRNPLGDNFESTALFEHFDFSGFVYTTAVVYSWDRYVLVSCRDNADSNNRLLLCDLRQNSVDTVRYEIQSFAEFGGLLHGGSSLSETTYELFTGFDDTGQSLINIWESKNDNFGSDLLKKIKRLRLRGQIAKNQSIGVYLSYDGDSYSQVGTIYGKGSYVDLSNPAVVGGALVGEELLGGGSAVTVYPYYVQLKLASLGKFRVRKIKFIAEEIGYASIQMVKDTDIWTYQDKIPAKYRQKQNVSLDGTQTDQ